MVTVPSVGALYLINIQHKIGRLFVSLDISITSEVECDIYIVPEKM